MAKKINNVFLNENENSEYGKILMDADGGVIQKKNKKKKKVSKAWSFLRPVVIVAISIVVGLLICIFGINYFLDSYFSPVDETSSEVVEVNIENSASLSEISEVLYENDLIRDKLMFKLYADFSDMSYQLKAGTYYLSPSMNYDDILYTLIKGKPQSAEVSITFREGLSVYEESEILIDPKTGLFSGSAKFLELCKGGSAFDNYPFIKAVIEKGDERNNVLDGYLFPDTYRYFTDTTEEGVIIKQLNRFGEIFTDEYELRAEELGMTVDDVVILASIIEKEAISSDFAKVSAVFHNRLDEGMPLGSCATMQIVTGAKKYTFTDEELAMESPYNTYLNTGLPVGPICSPGKAAIEAALYPDQEFIEENYLYFCLTDPADGSQVFAKTYDEHLANVAEWEEYWN